MTLHRRDWLTGAAALSLLGACGARETMPSPRRAPAPADRILEPGLVYLNTASVGPTSRAVREHVIAAAQELEANPVREAYWSEETVLTAAEHAHARAAALLGCAVDQLLFTRSTTEAMNTVAQSTRLGAGDRVLTTDQEHEGGSLCWQYLAERRGVVVDTVAIAPDDSDVAIVGKLEAAIKSTTRLVSISHVLFTTGRVMPIAETVKLARAHQLLCVIDGAQAVGAMPVDVVQLGCHAYAAPGHKWLLGPVGTGLLYLAADAADAIRPIQWEAGHKLVGGATGLTPLPMFVGLGAAIDETFARGIASTQRRNLALRERAFAQLAALPKLRMLSPPAGPLATALVTCALPDGIEGKAFIRALLAKHRVQIKAIDHGFQGIRLSPHTFNTETDVDAAVRAIATELA